MRIARVSACLQETLVLAVRYEITSVHVEVAGDLAKQERRKIASLVHRNGGGATVGMANSLVRANRAGGFPGSRVL